MIKSVHTSDNATMPEVLYHYTTQHGLLGILGSHSIWATQIQYMNDENELKEAIKVARSNLDTFSKSAEDKQTTTICQLLQDALEQIEQINVFVFSMSEESDLLSQWRAYCPNSGYAIGFNVSELLQQAKQQGFYLVPCIYDYSAQRALMEPVVLQAVSRFKQELAKWPEDYEAIRDRVISSYFSEFIEVALRIKNSAFSEEKEWRLISRPIRFDNPQLKHRATDSLIVPYFDFRLDRKDGNMVELKEIVIGPTSHQTLASSSLSGLLSPATIRWKAFRQSRIPYRIL